MEILLIEIFYIRNKMEKKVDIYDLRNIDEDIIISTDLLADLANAHEEKQDSSLINP